MSNLSNKTRYSEMYNRYECQELDNYVEVVEIPPHSSTERFYSHQDPKLSNEFPSRLHLFQVPEIKHLARQYTKKHPNVKQKQEVTKKTKSKLQLSLSIGITSGMILTALIGLPEPFNYILSLALAGPLTASILGFRA